MRWLKGSEWHRPEEVCKKKVPGERFACSYYGEVTGNYRKPENHIERDGRVE
jgi:hypothetical protein